jgi:hypothetical protein
VAALASAMAAKLIAHGAATPATDKADARFRKARLDAVMPFLLFKAAPISAQ